MENESAEPKPSESRSWRRASVAVWVLVALIFSAIVVLPTALMKLGYGDQVLTSKVEGFGLTAESKNASGGWFTPFVFNDVTIRDEAGFVDVKIERIETEKSLFGLLTAGDDIGRLTIIAPDTKITLDDNGKLPLDVQPSGNPPPDMQFEVRDSAFKLAVPWRPLPIVEVSQVDVNGRIMTDAEGRWLEVDPVTLFDHEPLSEAQTEQNLALIAPVLSQTTALEGEISATLEAARFPLNDEGLSPFPIQGTAVLHSLNARLKQNWAEDVGRLVGQVVRKNVPSRLQIAADSSVAFVVDDVGIHHAGLAFVLPDLLAGATVESSGTVKLDEQLDLNFAVQLPQVQSNNPLLSAMNSFVRQPLQLKVTGTVDEPKMHPPAGFGILDQMAASNSPTGVAEPPPPVSNAVMDLIGSAAMGAPSAGKAEDVTGGIIGLIRSIREAKKDAPPREKKRRRKKK